MAEARDGRGPPIAVFVVNAAKSARFPLLLKWRLRSGSWNASKGLVDHFLREIQVVALFAAPELGEHQVYRVPAAQYHPAEVVTLPPDALLPPVSPGKAIIEVTSGKANFYVGSESNPQTDTSYSRGFGYWYQDVQNRRFESGDLLPEALAKRFTSIEPLLAETEERLKAALRTKENRQLRSTLERQLASLTEREKQWSRMRIPVEQVAELLRNAELFEAGDPAASKGLLLAGGPGTGKSLIARTLAHTSGCTFHSATLADLKAAHIWWHGSKRPRAMEEGSFKRTGDHLPRRM